ncbi:hypothetical protein BOX15_Mlig014707g1, partial [Macrostomum lignano]
PYLLSLRTKPIMKFRAATQDAGCVQYLCKAIVFVSKLANNCVMRCTPDCIYFVLCGHTVEGGVRVWFEIKRDTLFSDYSMAGLDEEHEEVQLEVVLETMVGALTKSFGQARGLRLKLTRRDAAPLLQMELELPTVLTDESRHVTHNVPVRVVPLRYWGEFQTPLEPEFDISFYFPPLSTVRNVLDRMRNLSNRLTIFAQRSTRDQGKCSMRLSVTNSMASVSTTFKDLQLPRWRDEPVDAAGDVQNGRNGDEGDEAEDAEAAAEGVDVPQSARPVRVAVDIRKIGSLLSSPLACPTRIVCNLVRHRVAQFFIFYDEVQLQYFIPALDTE